MSAFLTIKEAAAELRKTPRWLQDWLRTNPVDCVGTPYFTKIGRDKLFSQSDISRIAGAFREQTRCRLSSFRPRRAARRIGAFAGHISDASVTEALALARSGSRRKSSRQKSEQSNVVPLPNQNSPASRPPQRHT